MFGVYEQLVHELGCRDHRGVVLLGCNPEISQFALPDGATLLVLRHMAGQPDLLEGSLRRVLASPLRGRVQVLAAGGDEGAREVLLAAKPVRTLGRRFEFLAVDDRGEPWSGRRARPGRELRAALDDVRRRPGHCRLDPHAFQAWLDERAAFAKETIEHIGVYQRSMLARRPWAAWSLAAALVLLFALETLWGGARSVPTLVRMGALVGEGERAVEPWRLLSTSFLHGGAMHLVGNALVVLLIGSFLERLVGPWRFLVLWTASVAGGSLAALAFSSATIVVGASGGGWGLMCAAGVLAARPTGLIPDSLARPLLHNVGRIVLLNLLISFIPGIALSAHLGGGVAGILVALLGVMTLGMRSAEVAAGSPGREPLLCLVLAAGLAAALLLAGSVALSLSLGRPWSSGADGPWTRHDLGAPGVSVELPDSLGPARTRTIDERTTEHVFGDGISSPWLVTVRVAIFKPKILTTLRLFREYRALKKALGAEPPPPGMSPAGEAVEAETTDVFTLEDELHRSDGARLWRQARVVPTVAVVVSVETAAEAVEAGDLLHERVFASLRTGFEPAPAADGPPAGGSAPGSPAEAAQPSFAGADPGPEARPSPTAAETPTAAGGQRR